MIYGCAQEPSDDSMPGLMDGDNSLGTRVRLRCAGQMDGIIVCHFDSPQRAVRRGPGPQCQQTVIGPSISGLVDHVSNNRSRSCDQHLVLCPRELTRCLHGSRVTANCLHPGFVATRFGDQSGGRRFGLSPHQARKFFAISPAEGAETMVYLASSPDVAEVRGQYFYKQDARADLLLWQRTAALAGLN